MRSRGWRFAIKPFDWLMRDDNHSADWLKHYSRLLSSDQRIHFRPYLVYPFLSIVLRVCSFEGFMMDSITIHGLPRVFSSRSWISKVFWSVAFITSCSFLSYLLYDSVKTHQKKKFLVRTEYLCSNQNSFHQDSLYFVTFVSCSGLT